MKINLLATPVRHAEGLRDNAFQCVFPLLWNEEFRRGQVPPKPQLPRGYTVLRGASWSTVPHLRVSICAWQLWDLTDQEAEGRPLEGRGSAQLAWTFVFQKPWSGFL